MISPKTRIKQKGRSPRLVSLHYTSLRTVSLRIFFRTIDPFTVRQNSVSPPSWISYFITEYKVYVITMKNVDPYYFTLNPIKKKITIYS